MGSRDQIFINGVPVRIHGNFEREVTDETGARTAEMEIVVIIRGRAPQKQFLQLISNVHVRLDMQESGQMITWFARITNHSAVASGSGEAVMYRHDMLFRELPDSYKRRMEEKAAYQAANPKPAPVRAPVAAEPEQAESISEMLANADPSGWGEAIRKLKETRDPELVVPDEPLTPIELVAVETVLTNLRIDALIDQIVASGFLRREAIDERFRALIEQRFESEAIPLVGEKAAKQAARDIQKASAPV